MENWEYKSLEWIHKIREEDYNETKNLSPKELVEKTCIATKDVVKKMGLEIVQLEKKHA